MIQCGELCAGCADECREVQDGETFIECVRCHGSGCKACDHAGRTAFVGCPREYAKEVTQECNLAAITIVTNQMPVAGGTLDQSSWFLDCWHALAADRQQIELERNKRRG